MACDLFDAIHPSRVQRLRKSFGIGSTTTERLARRAPIKSVDSMEIPVSRLGDDRAVGVHRVAVAVNSRIDPAAVQEQPSAASCRVPPSRLPRVLRGSPVGLCRTRPANHVATWPAPGHATHRRSTKPRTAWISAAFSSLRRPRRPWWIASAEHRYRPFCRTTLACQGHYGRFVDMAS